ncbi:MAG TPA: aminoacetone oxidase family FAD-binding enzyme [Moraxellaceae bacterium]|nr:aminoacetone oxidase family FAD-binding enzyme [Moraxellaceae bacterium]
MAAEVLSSHGIQVDLYDSMPSVGRKFLLAGRGGLNLTHAEALPRFVSRYAVREAQLAPLIDAFTPDALRAWAQGLGISTFVGTSQRVFPTDMKAAPILRAWLHRLREAGVRFHMRHRWLGWDEAGAMRFHTPSGELTVTPRATMLALGGGSWSRLGSDGAWWPWLQARGVDVAPLQAANCGFDVAATGPDRTGWSDFLRQKFAGQPIKPVALQFTDPNGHIHRQQGEFVLTDTGVEGSLIYAFSAAIRDQIAANGHATVYLDLLPSHSPEQVLAETSRARGPRSLSTHLKSRLGIQGLKMALLHEVLSPAQLTDPAQLAQALKALPITLKAPRPMDEAISTAGGVRFEGMNAQLMLNSLPGVFCAGEMLDWEAPTGGYLLTASMATGRHAAQGVITFLAA